MFIKNLISVILGIVFLLGISLATQSWNADKWEALTEPQKEEIWTCINHLKSRIDSLSELDSFEGLNGETIYMKPLIIFAEVYGIPLNPKFYYFPSEIREIETKDQSGKIVKIRVRVYHNYMDACFPEGQNPDDAYGYVGEIYDPSGKFLGVAVGMGMGLYAPVQYMPEILEQIEED